MASNSSNIDNIPAGVQGTSTAAAAAASLPQTQGTQPQRQGTTASSGSQTIPQKANEVPLTGLQPGADVPFGDQVKGHAKMFAGKVFGNDKEVQQGAERIAGTDTQQQQL